MSTDDGKLRTERLHIKDLPDDTIDRVGDQIAMFTVGLQRLVFKDGAENLHLIGTGTLVVVGGQRCILTAEHVLAQLKSDDRLALLSSFTKSLRRHTFDLSHLTVHRIARGTDDARGPDIGLIGLPHANLGNLLAEKSFFNIDKRRERYASGLPPKDRGFWFTIGVVGESETLLPVRPGYNKIKGFQGLCGVSVAPREHEEAGFDYLDVRVSYASQNPELPRSFGGFSGGGLWHVPLHKRRDGAIDPDEYLLSGVVFYQTAVEDGVRLLRCHGQKTVYSVVPEHLAASTRVP